MKNTSKFDSLKEKELTKKDNLRGGKVPDIDKPRRPGGGGRPPFRR